MKPEPSKSCPACGLVSPATTSRCDCGYSFAEHAGVCYACGAAAPTKYVEFYQNIGALVVRHHKAVKGPLCKPCIHRFFWEFTAVTLVLGWWGLISLVVTPIYLLNNVGRYVLCIPLPAPRQSAAAPTVERKASRPRRINCWRCKTPLAVSQSPEVRETTCPKCGTRQELPA
jgi:hypothetical protein